MHARQPPRHCSRHVALSLFVCLVLGGNPIPALASDSPVVQGMLRMMEDFGFIDRDRLPLGVPYLPSASTPSPFSYPIAGGPMATVPGMAQIPGTTPFGSTMAPGFPGQAQPGSAWPGVPWANAPPGLGQGNPQRPTWIPGIGQQPVAGLLDGIWELNRGGLVVIQADAARLYVTRDRFQDYLIRYDDTHFWWRPRDGSKFERYRYRMEEGRMVLADKDGNILLLRRRR